MPAPKRSAMRGLTTMFVIQLLACHHTNLACNHFVDERCAVFVHEGDFGFDFLYSLIYFVSLDCHLCIMNYEKGLPLLGN